MAEYIEKKAAILALLDKGQCNHRYRLGEVWELNFDEIREAIADVPAADVRENVNGEWNQHYETTSDNETLPFGWECSLCGRWEMEKQPFCNCGAKMEVQDG